MADFTVLSSSDTSVSAYLSTTDDIRRIVAEACRNKSAFSGIDPYKLREDIARLGFLPEEGIGWEKTAETIEKTIAPHMLRTWSTDYMPHLHSPALIETIAAELFIASFNSSMDSWDQGPAATELECSMIKGLLGLYGYTEDGDGVFTSGGSQSNFSAIACHLNTFLKKRYGHDAKKHGLPDFYRKLRLYTSEISHFSMEKSAHMLGLGYDAVVHLPIDDLCRIDITEAERIIIHDIESGLIPFCINATIGTTDFGSIDDIEALRAIADKAGCMLHADAAYGSGAVMSSRYGNRLGNLSLADSITVDFHKMFLMPISCSALLVKDKKSFDAFMLHADYLNREEDEEDGYINLVGKSLQTTRRFDALKVFTSFSMRGRKGFDEIISKVIGNAEYFYSLIEKDPDFITSCPPQLSSVVFALRGGDELNKKVRRQLLSEGIVIGQTVYQGKTMLKFTLLNPALDESRINELYSKLKDFTER